MPAAFSKITNCLVFCSEWEPNPILLKELRQAVRSQILIGVLMLFLVLLFLGSVMSLARQNMMQDGVLEMGRNMFDVCLAVLSVSSLVFIPIYTGIRVALEQYQADLVLHTPLPVTKLVRGKLLAGVCLAGLFFSVCVPFMAFSSLLRGLDWLTIQFVLFFLFFAICIAILAAVAVAVQPFPIPVKLVCGVVFSGSLVVACGLLLVFFFGVVRSGIAPLLTSSSFWEGLIGMSGFGIFAAMASYSLSTSHIVRNTHGNDSYGEIKFTPSNG